MSNQQNARKPQVSSPRATGESQKPKTWLYVLGGCGCAIVVVMLMGVGLLFFVLFRISDPQAVRGALNRTRSQNNMKIVTIGNMNYLNTYQRYPASYSTDSQGRPLLSWRVHLLPFLEHQDLYDQFHLDEPWDSPHNRTLIPLMPDVYQSPLSQAGEGMTVYLGNAVEGGTFEKPTMATSLSMAGYKPRSITDGEANTIHVVEVNDNHAVTWTQPADFDPPFDSDIASWLRLDGNQNYQAAMVNGALIRESADDRERLKGWLTRDGGEVIGPQYAP